MSTEKIYHAVEKILERPKTYFVLEQVKFPGELEEISFPQILNYLFWVRESGILILENEKDIVQISFHHGYPRRIDSSFTPQPSLIEILESEGKLSADTVETLRRQGEERTQRIGEVLLQEGMISSHDLYLALKLQALEKILYLFQWKKGSFRFEFKEGIEGESYIEAKPAEIILTGIRRYYDLSDYWSFFEPYEDALVIPKQTTPHDIETLKLLPQERRLLSFIDGRRTLQEVLEKGRMSLSEKLNFLFALIVMGAIELQHPGEDDVEGGELSSFDTPSGVPDEYDEILGEIISDGELLPSDNTVPFPEEDEFGFEGEKEAAEFVIEATPIPAFFSGEGGGEEGEETAHASGVTDEIGDALDRLSPQGGSTSPPPSQVEVEVGAVGTPSAASSQDDLLPKLISLEQPQSVPASQEEGTEGSPEGPSQETQEAAMPQSPVEPSERAANIEAAEDQDAAILESPEVPHGGEPQREGGIGLPESPAGSPSESTLFSLLGLPEDATQQEIQRAYLRRLPEMSRRLPDPTALEELERLKEAFAILGNMKSRRAYERRLFLERLAALPETTGKSANQAYHKALDLLEQGATEEAERLLRKAVLAAPQKTLYRARLAWLFWRFPCGERELDLSRPLQWLNEHLERHPDDWEALLALGKIHRSQHRFHLARQTFLRVRQLKPDLEEIERLHSELPGGEE
ncbi:MAG: DUF4388 domain-containing protein [Deltaproteobacteria bacterium]|nr:MAG: DUF4388 domain-containing protein [Deltaproteobacteria bacterium]